MSDEKRFEMKKIVLILAFSLLPWVAFARGAPRQDASAALAPHYSGWLVRHDGLRIPVSVARTAEEKRRGLSGVRPAHFGEEAGMLFWYEDSGARRFWMPDTYFALDIVFLDEDLRILEIEKNIPAHPGRAEPPAIPATRTIVARHVLEIKSGTPLAARLRPGDRFRFVTSTTPQPSPVPVSPPESGR